MPDNLVLVNNVYSHQNPGDSAIVEAIGRYVLEVDPGARIYFLSQFWRENDAHYRALGIASAPQLWDIPMDDRMGPRESVEMTPELISSLEEMFRKHYMNWLDEPLPILDDKTPRQACKTKAGKQKVAMLIRTIPQPVGNDGVEIDIPRQEMLRSLGLESK